MLRIISSVVAATAVAFGAQSFAAGLINADDVSASSQFNGQFSPFYTIDGSGLPVGFDETSIHDDYALDNHWTTSRTGGPVGQNITWFFANPQALSGMWVWNHLSNIISSNLQYEPVLVDLEAKNLGGDTVFNFTNVELLPNEELPQFGAAQLISFGDLYGDIFSITLTVIETQGSTSFTGLAEVRFTDMVVDGQIPVPAAGWLLATGLAGAMLRRRRSKAA
ncbi:MAG: PEP-CTERM sorting domain-containing protein [Parvularculaceae bacterium]|nr:PEP-CTERM sorting domain-containing protein [Parvularculaceae bacterium]